MSMPSPDEESTLGILDIDDLCKDFDSIVFAEKVNETASALVKQNESFRHNLHSSYSKPPKLLNLLGDEQIKKPVTTAEVGEMRQGLLSKSVFSLTPYPKGLDSKYFLENNSFDPPSLRYSDSLSNTAIDSHLTVSGTSTLLQGKDCLKARGDSINSDNSTLKMDLSAVPLQKSLPNSKESSGVREKVFEKTQTNKSHLQELTVGNFGSVDRVKMQNFQLTMESDKLVFLPEEMAARSTTVLGKLPFPPDENASWNISGFSMDFNEKRDSGFSSSPMADQFLSDGDAKAAIDNDEQNFNVEHALELSDNHVFGDVTALESTHSGVSVTASKVFGHESWMLGTGLKRPSFGMVFCSPIRQRESVNSDVYSSLLKNEETFPNRSGVVTRRDTYKSHVVAPTFKQDENLPKDSPAIDGSKESENPESSATTLVNSSSKNVNQGSASSNSSSLPVSPVPSCYVSQSCQSSFSQSNVCHSSCSSATSGVQSALTQVAPFPWTRLHQNVNMHSQQAVLPCHLHTQLSAMNIFPDELPPITVCLGERVEFTVPVHNQFSETLQFQINFSGVFSNDHTLSHNNIKQLISWDPKTDILQPNQKKDIPVSFLARTPGLLYFLLEFQWFIVDCLNKPAKMEKTYCPLSCDVVLPKVNISTTKLNIKYHAFSNSAETTSFTLMNHTPASVTIGLHILVSGGEDVMWSDGELFFALDHLHQYASNHAHQWIDTVSPFVLSVCLAAGTTSVPSHAEIPISFRRGPTPCLTENNKTATEYGATVIVSQKNFQPARSLAAVRVAVVSSPVPLCSSLSTDKDIKVEPLSTGKEIPIIKSRKHVYFHATDISGCRKEEIALKNSGPVCSVSASIKQESSVFQLCPDSCQSPDNEWLLKKKEVLTLTVAFRPTDKSVYQATLVINAVTNENSLTSYRIMLHGCGGCSKLTLHGCSATGDPLQRPLKRLCFSKGIGEEKQLLILNQGVRPAFVSVAETSDSVKLSASKFVVLPFSQKVLTVRCLNRNLNENLLVFYGEEQLRQALFKKLSSLKKPGLLSRFDATGNFKDQDQVLSEMLYPTKDITALGDFFYKHVSHFDIQLSYLANGPLDNSSVLEVTLSSD